MGHKLSQQEVLEFFNKNGLKPGDIMEITGYKKSQVYVWFDKEITESKLPWEIWLLLNALFNRKAQFITEIIEKYSKGEALTALMEQPEQIQKFHDETKLIKETLQDFSETEAIERREKNIERINQEHLERVMREYYQVRGTGPKIESREAYKQIREIEKALGLEKAITFQKLEELNKEYNPDKKDNHFIRRLLQIYDEYIKQREEERLIQYLEGIDIEIQNRLNGAYPRKFVDRTPEQEAEILKLKEKESSFDNKLKKSRWDKTDDFDENKM